MGSKAGCQEVAHRWQLCEQGAPCKEICEIELSLGCSSQSVSACAEACNANLNSAASHCKSEVAMLNKCQASNADACNGEKPAIADACVGELMERAGCVEPEFCNAWCVAAEALGCGDSCLSDCETELEDECGDSFEQIMECGFSHLGAACIDNTLLATGSCDDEVVDWKACLSGELD